MEFIQMLIRMLNSNEGFLMAILTFVYVITTIGILRSTHKSQQQAAKFHEEEHRPYVIFNLIIEDDMIMSVRSNIGKRPAYDVRATIDPPIVVNYVAFEPREPICYKDVLIPMLAPGQAIKDFVNDRRSFFRDNPDATFTMEVSYRDSLNIKYKEPTTPQCFKHLRDVFPDDWLEKQIILAKKMYCGQGGSSQGGPPVGGPRPQGWK